jgi:hypothetical protein
MELTESPPLPQRKFRKHIPNLSAAKVANIIPAAKVANIAENRVKWKGKNKRRSMEWMESIQQERTARRQNPLRTVSFRKKRANSPSVGSVLVLGACCPCAGATTRRRSSRRVVSAAEPWQQAELEPGLISLSPCVHLLYSRVLEPSSPWDPGEIYDDWIMERDASGIPPRPRARTYIPS